MFALIIKIGVGLACLPTAVYALPCARKRVGHVLLASGLFLIGADSTFFNLQAIYITHFVRETASAQSTLGIASAVSSALMVIRCRRHTGTASPGRRLTFVLSNGL